MSRIFSTLFRNIPPLLLYGKGPLLHPHKMICKQTIPSVLILNGLALRALSLRTTYLRLYSKFLTLHVLDKKKNSFSFLLSVNSFCLSLSLFSCQYNIAILYYTSSGQKHSDSFFNCYSLTYALLSPLYSCCVPNAVTRSSCWRIQCTDMYRHVQTTE